VRILTKEEAITALNSMIGNVEVVWMGADPNINGSTGSTAQL
jgi:hypothetical protein